MGIYLIWPAFFTNVTDAYRLGRAGRIRTDLGGVYFNAIFVLVLTGTYLATGYSSLASAVVLIHLEIVQQLLPSLRLDGYFILADLIGVPDLFRRIGPTLRTLIPGRSADPGLRKLKRSARISVTIWVLLVVPMLFLQLGFVILDGPHLVRTFARSLLAQLQAATTQFGHADIAAALPPSFRRSCSSCPWPACPTSCCVPSAARSARSSRPPAGVRRSASRPPW